MPESPQSQEKRKHPRAKVNLFADLSARLDTPSAAQGLIEDVSVGGLRIEIPAFEDAAAFSPQIHVAGEIVSDNPAMQMSFSGKIVWREMVTTEGRPSLRIGIVFDPEVVLSEVLQSLKPQRGAG